MNTDTQLHKNVLDALVRDHSINASNVALAVAEGIVCLSGTVGSYAEKMRIERCVKHVAGVRGIAEELMVNPPEHHRKTDLEIAEAALNILHWDIMVPADDIQVKVEQGWVTLTGNVPWHFQRVAAEKALENLNYVRGLSNKITLIPAAKPANLKGHVERALKQHPSKLVRSVTVSVVDDDTVTLSGQVDHAGQHDDAARIAWHVPGVREVINIIDIATDIAR